MTAPPAVPAGSAPGPLLVMGAGSVGVFVGGALQASGVEVHFVGRPRVLDTLRTQGLTLSAVDAPPQVLSPSSLHLHEQPATAPAPRLALLCVKSGATRDAAAQLAAALPADTPVLSLQNGVGNVEAARQVASRLRWLAGMVPYNIAATGRGHFHRGTAGRLAATDAPCLRRWQPWFERSGLGLDLHADLGPVQWGKLLMNLNNPVNALSGLPLKAQLMDRGYRRALAALQDEALAVMAAAGIVPARVGPLPPRWQPRVLRLPDALFGLVAAGSLRIDEQARSSMADDVALGRPTEIDALSGEIVRLARSKGTRAPLNERIVALVRRQPVPRLQAGALLRELGLG